MTKEKYMALADFQTLWSDKLKTYIFGTYATKTALQQEANRATLAEAQLASGTLYPVNMDTITPSSTFIKNNVLGINGVIYRAKNATSNLPVTLVTQDGAFVYHEINGHKSYVVDDPELNSDWEIWTDASMEYWRESLDNALSDEITNRQSAVANERNRAMQAETNLAAGTLYPVDADSITLNSTFQKNAVLGINGVMYRAKNTTSELPVTLVTQDGAFVYHEINGHKAYVVADPTVNSDWEVWTDSSMEYWRESFDAALDAEAVARIAGDNGIKNIIGVETDYEFVDLGLPSGTLWAKCNIGATEETGYGGFWQYGKGAADFFETAGEDMYAGKEDPLSLQYDAAAQVMGNPWHMPTKAQFEELIANTTYTWETNFNGSGVGGAKFTAANGNYIFLPASGVPYDDGTIDDRNNLGSYMSSTPADGVTGNPYWWWYLDLSTQRSPRIHVEATTGEYAGMSVRGVKSTIKSLLDTKLSLASTITYNGTTYTVQQLLEKVASLM